MDKNVLDMMDDVIMELGTMSLFSLLLVRNHGDLTEDQLENALYSFNKKTVDLHLNLLKIVEELEESSYPI